MIKGRDKLYLLLLSTIDDMLLAATDDKESEPDVKEGKAALNAIKNILITNKELFTEELKSSISTTQTNILMEIESCLLMILSAVINYPKYTTTTTDILYQWIQSLVNEEFSAFANTPAMKAHLH